MIKQGGEREEGKCKRREICFFVRCVLLTVGTEENGTKGRGRGARDCGGKERKRLRRDTERERENSSSKTLFSKDCSLGSLRPV